MERIYKLMVSTITTTICFFLQVLHINTPTSLKPTHSNTLKKRKLDPSSPIQSRWTPHDQNYFPRTLFLINKTRLWSLKFWKHNPKEGLNNQMQNCNAPIVSPPLKHAACLHFNNVSSSLCVLLDFEWTWTNLLWQKQSTPSEQGLTVTNKWIH